MDLQALSLLVDIIESGNLSRAAHKLGMSRANVSKRLNQFEKRLGAELLRRTTRQLEPTELGWQLYEHARNIRHELIAANESLETLGRSLSGTVRLNVPSGYGQHMMSQWFMEFMRLHPRITLDVIFDNSLEDMVKGTIDFSIRVLGDVPSNMVAHRLGAVDYVACAAPGLVETMGMPQTLAELKKQPLITSSLTEQKMRLAGHVQPAGQHQPVRPRLMSANFFFLRDAILQGLGVGVVPRYMVAQEMALGTLVHLPLPAQELEFLSAHMYLLYMPSHYQTKAQSTLIDFLRKKSAEIMDAKE